MHISWGTNKNSLIELNEFRLRTNQQAIDSAHQYERCSNSAYELKTFHYKKQVTINLYTIKHTII